MSAPPPQGSVLVSAKNLLFSGGPPGGHDFGSLAAAVAAVLGVDGIETEIVSDPDELEDRLTSTANRPDLLTVLALRWTMGAPRYGRDRAEWAFSPDGATRSALEGFVAAGGGLLALHTACVCFDDWREWGDLLGAAWEWDRSSHQPVGPALVEPSGRDHPITAMLPAFTVVDEIYEQLALRPKLEPLLTSTRGARDEPVLWARAHGDGRVVVDTLGHDAASWHQPVHQVIVRRSAAWALGLPDSRVRRIGAAGVTP